MKQALGFNAPDRCDKEFIGSIAMRRSIKYGCPMDGPFNDSTKNSEASPSRWGDHPPPNTGQRDRYGHPVQFMGDGLG